MNVFKLRGSSKPRLVDTAGTCNAQVMHTRAHRSGTRVCSKEPHVRRTDMHRRCAYARDVRQNIRLVLVLRVEHTPAVDIHPCPEVLDALEAEPVPPARGHVGGEVHLPSVAVVPVEVLPAEHGVVPRAVQPDVDGVPLLHRVEGGGVELLVVGEQVVVRVAPGEDGAPAGAAQGVREVVVGEQRALAPHARVEAGHVGDPDLGVVPVEQRVL
eukprot:gene2834-biopygen3543